jgi:NAD-dependent DNA ligase
VADFYRLKQEDVPERVLAEIERSRTAELGRFLAGLGVGKKRAAELMTKYADLRAMSDELGEDARALVALGVNPQSLREKK